MVPVLGTCSLTMTETKDNATVRGYSPCAAGGQQNKLALWLGSGKMLDSEGCLRLDRCRRKGGAQGNPTARQDLEVAMCLAWVLETM